VSVSEDFIFCRFTQLGVLRMLTTKSAMGADVLTLAKAWSTLDRLTQYWGGVLLPEPAGLETRFRTLTNRLEVSPKYWADAYLAAFAGGHGLTLVTFDKVLARSVDGSIVLAN
jgi:predicted nucleic acid-binding protein